MDIKAPNNELHKKITGKSMDAPVNMFKYLNSLNFPIWVRYVLVPGYTDDLSILKETRAFLDTLSNVKRIEVLPYHPFAIPKYEELKIDYQLKNTNTPSKESIKIAEEILGVN